ncbi:nitronate monooxygenase [Diaphorobacter sp.]|uniref:nitronate monooxygenase n=1 Tax=Diaphorobacter sp. TaxID=1934310 RepID=UPI0028ADB587|nr:nitronate monooxygenase [Diaphorobacter sp.]
MMNHSDAHDASSTPLPRTPLCDMLDCRLPLILAGMGGVARSELVAAVSEAGGFGFLGMVREPLALIDREVRAVRDHTAARFGVNLIPAGTPAELLDQQVQCCVDLQVPVVGLFWDVNYAVIARLKAANITVVHQVGSVAQALQAQSAGVDALIVQGVEAGGHVSGRQPLEALLAAVLAVVDVPVAAAGGISTGEQVAQLMTQGAQAAVLGTALLATQESFAHDFHKQRVVQARADDTVLTEDFHINWPAHAAVRVLRNSVTQGQLGDPFTQARRAIGEEEGRPIYLFSTDSPLRSMSGDFESMALYAGRGVDAIDSIPTAAQRMASIMQSAQTHWRTLHRPEVEVSSPVCYAPAFERERNEALMAQLNELLEAERAGVRVTVQTLAQVSDPATRQLMEAIHHDEVQWCVMLLHAVRDMGGTTSQRTGAFFQKAMAIENVAERLAFLNRGQGWVAKRVAELLERVEDPALHKNLTRMLDSHKDNLTKVNEHLALK